MAEGKLIVISGASGVGKGTVLRRLLGRCDNLHFSVSATTRAPRPGEKDGVDYYFVSREAFEQMIADGKLLEYDAHLDNYYGTPSAQLEDKRALGPVILDIDPKGARIVKDKVPEAVLVFIMPPSMEALHARLRGRNDTCEAQIRLRDARAEWEIEQSKWYDHVVINDDADRCADEIFRIITDCGS